MATNLADSIFKCIFINEKFCISIQISLKFVPRGPVDNRPALVQVMAWRQTGDQIHWCLYAALGGVNKPQQHTIKHEPCAYFYVCYTMPER